MLHEESDHVSLALSDGEVGIGLSLLQDLANELRAGNGDDDEEDKWSRSSGSSSVELRRHQESKSDSEDGTIKELNYQETMTIRTLTMIRRRTTKWSLHSLRRLLRCRPLHLHSPPSLHHHPHSQALFGGLR
jgi:hypothetical protein